MRTTIAIDEKLTEELLCAEPNVSRSAAIRRAVEQHVRRKRLDEFLELAGSRLVDIGWKEAELFELNKLKKYGRKR